MAQVTYVDPYASVAAQYNIRENSRFREYAQEQMRNMAEFGSQISQNFMAAAQKRYDQVVDSTFIRRVDAARRRAQSIWVTDEIQRVNEYWQLQNAPPTMAKYLMAEPTYRKLYTQQRCEGYGKRYVDDQPGVIGEQHRHYRQAMDSYVQFDDEGEWFAPNYSDTYSNEDEALLLREQDDIQHAWRLIRHAIAEGIDPGSVADNPL